MAASPVRRSVLGANPPEGFRVEPEFLSADEERDLLDRIAPLPLEEFEFHGCFGLRRRGNRRPPGAA